MSQEVLEGNKLSAKQKDVIRKMRGGMKLYTINGFNAKVCTSDNTRVPFPTLWKLEDLKLIEVKKGDWRSTIYQLTELGRTTSITKPKKDTPPNLLNK